MNGYAGGALGNSAFATLSDDDAWMDDALFGDPYREAPVRRGVSLSGGFQGHDTEGGKSYDASLHSGWYSCSSFGGAPLLEEYAYYSPVSGEGFINELAASGDALEQEFASGDYPPDLPRHPFFQLAVTTLHVQAAPEDCFQLGNHLLSFLRIELSAAAVKVCRAKFTAKAEVLQQCTVKLRVYRVANDVLAVELQRRSGDALAFAEVFGRLTQYLKGSFKLVDTSPHEMPALSWDTAFAQHSCAPEMQLGVPYTG